MSTATALRPSFDAGVSQARDPLAAAAESLAAAADASGTPDALVIAVRPRARDHRVIAAGTVNGPLRAAVSVVVAAENFRLWADIAHHQVAECPVTSLPEVVRAAAEGAGVTSVHVGTIGSDLEVGAVALWFGRDGIVADSGTQSHVLDVLQIAADEYLELAAEQARHDLELAAEQARADEEERRLSSTRTATSADGSTSLVIGSDDPDVDPLTGLASKARFDRALDEFEGEEATLLLIDLDGFTAITFDHGTDAGDRVLQEIALRLAEACGKTDLAARLDGDQFAILLQGSDRPAGLQTSKQLLGSIAAPLPAGIGPESVTATLAFAHEFGLVDMEELFESADDAVASGKRSGRGRMIIAS
jgi:diguanylate cyclase (GGDEF)-like protein